MTASQKISQRQAFYFIFTTGFGNLIFLHSVVIAISGRSAWVAELASLLVVVPLALWSCWLGEQAPGKTIPQILELAAGKIIGRLIQGMYALVSVAVAALMLRSLSGMMQLYLITETPLWVTILLSLALSTLIASSGIEVQGRLGEVLQVVLLSIWFFGLSFAFSGLDIVYYTPVFDRGLGEFTAGAWLSAGALAEVNLFLLVMVAALPRPAGSYRAITRGFVVAALILAFAVQIIVGTFGVERGSQIAFGPIAAVQRVLVSKYIQGVEVFIQVTYIILLILNVAVHSYSSWVTTSGIFDNRLPKLWLAGMFVLIAFLAMRVVVSMNEYFFFAILLARYVTLPFTVLVLFLTTVAVFIRGGKVGDQAE